MVDDDGTKEPPRFDGSDYAPEHDDARLAQQLLRIRTLMVDGAWRTLGEIEAATGDPPASISAQLRHLRKPRFGAWRVEKRSRGERKHGLYEYRLLEPLPGDPSRRERRRLLAASDAAAWFDALAAYVKTARAAGVPDDPVLYKLGRWLKAQTGSRMP